MKAVFGRILYRQWHLTQGQIKSRRHLTAVKTDIEIKTNAVLHNAKLFLQAYDIKGNLIPGHAEVDIGKIVFEYKSSDNVEI